MQYIKEKLTNGCYYWKKPKWIIIHRIEPVMNSDNECCKEKFHEFYQQILLLTAFTFKLKPLPVLISSLLAISNFVLPVNSRFELQIIIHPLDGRQLVFIFDFDSMFLLFSDLNFLFTFSNLFFTSQVEQVN